MARSEAHRVFHRTLLEGCGNPVLLETFDRLWTASELARRWAANRTPDRDHVGEHRRLEETVLARDGCTGPAPHPDRSGTGVIATRRADGAVINRAQETPPKAGAALRFTVRAGLTPDR